MEIKKQDLNEWQATLVEIKERLDDLYATLENRLDVNNEAKELVQIQHWEVLSHLTQPFMNLDQIQSRIDYMVQYIEGLMSRPEEKQQPHLTVRKSTKEMN